MLGCATMRTLPLACVLLTIAACSKDEDKPAPAPEKTAADQPAPTTPTQPTQPAAPTGKLTCDETVPTATRDKFFAGWELSSEDTPMANYVGVTCTFAKGTEIAVLDVSCPPWNEETYKASFDLARKNAKDAKDVAVGKGGILGTMHDRKTLQFRDDDAPCFATLTADVDLEALGKEMSAALTPDKLAN